MTDPAHAESASLTRAQVEIVKELTADVERLRVAYEMCDNQLDRAMGESERLRAQNEAYASQQDQWTRVVTAHTAELERLRAQNEQMLVVLRLVANTTELPIKIASEVVMAIRAAEGKP